VTLSRARQKGGKAERQEFKVGGQQGRKVRQKGEAERQVHPGALDSSPPVLLP